MTDWLMSVNIKNELFNTLVWEDLNTRLVQYSNRYSGVQYSDGYCIQMVESYQLTNG